MCVVTTGGFAGGGCKHLFEAGEGVRGEYWPLEEVECAGMQGVERGSEVAAVYG
jgi:hypothetical protein